MRNSDFPHRSALRLTAVFLLAGFLFCSCESKDAESSAPTAPKAGTFEILHAFSGTDGATPFGDLLEWKGELFGATSEGGSGKNGTLFKISTEGTFTSLHHFDGTDGGQPFGRLTQDGGIIYGACKKGGATDSGTLFRIRDDGTGFEVIHHFRPEDQVLSPHNGPILVGNRLIGTAFHGGSEIYSGVVYAYDLESSRSSVLVSLSSDLGRHPTGSPLLHGGWIYVTTSDYGHEQEGHSGTLLRFRPDGTELTVCHRFIRGQGHPYDCLVPSPDGWLYGTTHGAFSNPDENGTLFRWHPEHLTFEVLASFDRLGAEDGSKPNGSLIVSPDGRYLFGCTHGNVPRGGKRHGTLFAFDLTLRNLHTLKIFSGGESGDIPMRTPVFLDDVLYGLAAYSGRPGQVFPDGHGVIYAYHLGTPDTWPPPVKIQAASENSGP